MHFIKPSRWILKESGLTPFAMSYSELETVLIQEYTMQYTVDNLKALLKKSIKGSLEGLVFENTHNEDRVFICKVYYNGTKLCYIVVDHSDDETWFMRKGGWFSFNTAYALSVIG